MAQAKLETAVAKNFMLAGKAIFTLVSMKTGTRYTYKVRQVGETPCASPRWFVSLLTGPDNTSAYTYIGMIFTKPNGTEFRLTPKSKLPMTSLPVAGFDYTFKHLNAGTEPPRVEIYHEGRCGRCGRLLTVPESIAMGLGPECAGRM